MSEPCAHWFDGGYCGVTEGVDVFMPGVRCPPHTPAALAGRTKPVPDPALTLDGRREAAGADVTVPMTPASPTKVDARAVASGKRRSAPHDFKAARADLAGAR